MCFVLSRLVLNWGKQASLQHSSFSRYSFLSDYLTDLYTGKSKKTIRQKLTPVGIELTTSQVITLMLYQLS